MNWGSPRGGPLVGKVGALRKGKKAEAGERYRYYYCSWAMKGRALCDTCNGRAAAPLERVVVEYLGQFSDPKLVRERLETVDRKSVARKEAELSAATRRTADLEAAVTRDLDRLDRSFLTEEEFVRQSAMRREETQQLREREAALSEEVHRQRAASDHAERLPVEIRSVVEDFETLDVTRRKAWLQTIFKAAVVWNDGRVELEFRV